MYGVCIRSDVCVCTDVYVMMYNVLYVVIYTINTGDVLWFVD